MPIRVFMAKTQSKHFFRIDKPSAGGPLIVELPALANELGALGKSAAAAEQDNNNVARKNTDALSLFHDLRFTACGKNQTFARPRRPSSFHTVDPLRAEQSIPVSPRVPPVFAPVTN